MNRRIAISVSALSEIRSILNAGRWPHRGPAARAGWYSKPQLTDLARVSDVDWLTPATDTTPHARYEGLLLEGLTIAAEIGCWPWSGDAPLRPSRATCTVVDADGRLDALAMSDIQGTAVSVRSGDRAAGADAAAPAARFVIDRVEILDDCTKLVSMDDAHTALDEPITAAQFMPNVATLAWRPVPVIIGAVASVPALPANSDGTVRFLGDAPLAHIETVLDRGDAMEPSTFALAPDAQQLLMTHPPVGPVVCDVSSIGPGLQPATLQQALREIFRRREVSAWSAADAAAIDAATGYAGIGFYAADQTTGRQTLAAILPSYGAWWWQDDAGVIRVARVVAPEAHTGPLAFDLGRGDLADDLIATPDLAPNLSRRMTYRPNAQALGTGDLVTDLVDVPPARRIELTSLWRGQVFASRALPARYAHADAADPMLSVHWRREDAQAEIDRVVALYGVHRTAVRVRLVDPDMRVPEPGQIGRITYPRYGLEAGRNMLVRGRTRNLATGETILTLWG